MQKLEVECHHIQSEEDIALAWALMCPEFVSAGGNLRDQSVSEFSSFVTENGELWTANQKEKLLASLTLERLEGNEQDWIYINNGVVIPELRRTGSGVMDTLLETALNDQPPESQLIVLTVTWGIFDRLGFQEVSLGELCKIDPCIGQRIQQKIRPNKAVHIGIRLPVPSEKGIHE